MKKIFFVNNKPSEPNFLRKFKKKAQNNQISFTHVDIKKCAFNYNRETDTVSIFYKNKLLTDISDSVWFIRRWAPSEDGTALLCTILENEKVFFTDPKVNAQHEIKTSKLSQTFQLHYAGCKSPSTWVLSPEQYLNYKKRIIKELHFPVIIKTRGGQGKCVWKCDNDDELDSKISEIKKQNVDLCIFQEFIENNGDIRVVVFNNEIITAIHRYNPNHFLHNTSQGATANTIELTSKERKIAIKATKKIGLTLSGVDIVRSKYGPLIYEINKAPDINELTGKDVDSKIIESFIKNFILLK